MTTETDLGDELISLVYAATLGETSWQTFLDRMNALCPDAFSTFFFHDTRNGMGSLSLAAGGREDAQADYERYYSGLNPWMHRVAATPVGTGIIGEQIIERSDFNRTEYYNDFIRRNGLETGLGLTIFREDGCYFLLSTLTADKDADANLRRAAVLTRVAPHLTRAFRFYRKNRFSIQSLQFGTAIADAANVDLFLVDDGCRIVRDPVNADGFADSGGIFGIDMRGRVRFHDADMQNALTAMIAARGPHPATHSFAAGRYGVTMIRISMDHAQEFFAGPTVAVLIADRAAAKMADVSRLANTYSLTPAEERVFSELVSGHRLEDIAASRDISRETVRTQLKAIYAKTGLSSQSDLVRLAAGLIETR